MSMMNIQLDSAKHTHGYEIINDNISLNNHDRLDSISSFTIFACGIHVQEHLEWFGWIHPQVLLKNGFLTNCLLFGTPKFVVTSNWFQQSPFTVYKPCDYN